MAIVSSTYSLLINSQRIMESLQKDLGDCQKELSTGRKSDIAIDLGFQLRKSANNHSLYSTLETYLSNNLISSARLETTQTVLSDIASNAEKFKSSLLMAQNDSSGQKIITEQANNTLNLLISSLNTSNSNTYIFSGTKTDVQPLIPYFKNPQSPAKSAIDLAYSSNPPNGFGFTQISSMVSGITLDQMNNFISGPFSNLFSDTEWPKNWSSANNQPLKNSISPNLKLDTSITVNDPALRKFAMAYVMMADLGADRLNEITYQTLTHNAINFLEEGLSQLNATRARVGVLQQTIAGANREMTIQKDILNIQIGKLENSDQSVVAANINNLLNRIEASYTLTARLSNLSLTKYL